MTYTFSETRYLQTGDWGADFYIKALSSLELDQLRIALKPHADMYSGNVETFKNCFFPVYSNNEGGVEYVRFYKVLDEKQEHVYDFVRIESSAGVFFEAGTLKKSLVLWAGDISADSPQIAETPGVLSAWKDLYK